ncbi:MAG TPA: hypothetical protein PLO37_04400 [Candidatus Hydrogenedentes bacterium]|nr:hypothetical protein [Candidatus Hydrogenedentota bacterium]HPG66066.1 hypothetical protein [Candidatus Hydrogenedentota bacterium]
MKKTMLLAILAAMAVAMPQVSRALTLDESTCLILTNSDENNPGFDEQGGVLSLILAMIPDLDIPIPSDWLLWDFESVPTNPEGVMGDGIPDNFQMALLAAVLCSQESDPLLDLIRAQYDINFATYEQLLTDVMYVVNNANRIIDLMGGNPTANPPVIGIGPGLAAIPAIQDIVINWPDEGDTIGDLAEEIIDLSNTIKDYKSLLPVIVNVLTMAQPWFAGMGGLSSEMNGQINGLLEQAAGYLGMLDDLVDLLRSMATDYGPSGTGDISAALAAEINELADIAEGFSITIPQFLTYGVEGKTAAEPISAFGDWNHDGVTNLQVYNQVVTVGGGNREDFVYEVTKDVLVALGPADGQEVTAGSTQSVTWIPATAIAGDFVRIGLHRVGGVFLYWIALKTDNDGEFNWLVSPDLEAGTDYLIRVQSFDDSNVRDFTNTPFTVVNNIPPITVTAPNGGETWYTGDIVAITWTSNAGVVGPFVRIGLHDGATLVQWIALKTDNDGAFNWIVPYTMASSTNYKIRVQSYADNTVRDFSDKPYTITGAPILITKPARGNTVKQGEVLTVEWESNSPDVGDFVRIGLHNSGAFLGWTAFKTENDGVFTTVIPLSTPVGGGYKVRVQSYSNSDLRDFSQRFSITAH